MKMSALEARQEAYRRTTVARSRLEQALTAATCAYGALRVAGLVEAAVALERMTRELDAQLKHVDEMLMGRQAKEGGL